MVRARANYRVMVKLHGQCNAPGEVIGATRKCKEDEVFATCSKARDEQIWPAGRRD